jgi:hypothetical protein
MARASTESGLRVVAEIARAAYQKGLNASHEFLKQMPVHFHRQLPELNYTASP